MNLHNLYFSHVHVDNCDKAKIIYYHSQTFLQMRCDYGNE